MERGVAAGYPRRCLIFPGGNRPDPRSKKLEQFTDGGIHRRLSQNAINCLLFVMLLPLFSSFFLLPSSFFLLPSPPHLPLLVPIRRENHRQCLRGGPQRRPQRGPERPPKVWLGCRGAGPLNACRSPRFTVQQIALSQNSKRASAHTTHERIARGHTS